LRFYSQVISSTNLERNNKELKAFKLIKELRKKEAMTSAGRVPLWLVALVGGLGVFTVLGVFIYGSYSGLGSSL